MVPVPDPNKPFAAQDPIVLLGCVVFGESRSECDAAKIGVANVVKNRVERNTFGNGWSGVILKPYAFSSFNWNDINRSKLLRPLTFESRSVWQSCYQAAEAVYRDLVADNTGTAVFYFGPPLTAAPNAWGAVDHTVTLGTLQFYRISQ